MVLQGCDSCLLLENAAEVGVTADKYTVSSGSKVNVLELMVMVVLHCEYAELLNYILHMGEQQQKKIYLKKHN